MDIVIPNSKNRQTLRNYRQPTFNEALAQSCAISRSLAIAYPGYEWRVQINQNVVYIINTDLNIEQAYKCLLSDFDPEGRNIMKIGGEVLEMFNQPRERANPTLLAELERDIKGNAKAQT